DESPTQQVVQGSSGLGRVGEGIGEMQLIKVDVVNPHSAQRPLDALRDVGGAEVVVTLANAPLRGDDDALAGARNGVQAVFEDLLATAAAIDIGVIIQGNARLQSRFEGRDGAAPVVRADLSRVPRSR